ncbi:ATP-binding protein [uncultured Caulobacter sp.]|uniref:sensor histidine kinase n=1 Tax=uncultured Caulobacter sp. TaxID=158749 RepID=UPI002613178D|nr:ATP-binding protein [uncultured Caulobacter sp.]
MTRALDQDAEASGARGLDRLSRNTGMRLAAIQIVIVILAFTLAGYLAQAAISRLDRDTMREHMLGEIASLRDEVVQKGRAHLPYTVAKRTRLWRGFDYRLATPDGRLEAGRLPPAAIGWTEVSGVPARTGAERHRFLVYTERLADGSSLSVGRDLAESAKEMRAVNRALFLCGALGAAFCLAASLAFNIQAWRRIAQVARSARRVSAGRLDVRTPVRAGPPRDDLDDLALTFNTMLDRIGALIDQLRQVTTDVAHDMRTPLTRLRHKIERLRGTLAADSPEERAVARLDDDVGEILRTFDALLQLSEISRQTPPEAVMDLASAATHVAEAFRPDIEASGRRLEVACAPAAAAADPTLIAQVCANLLENALRHTPTGTLIRLETSTGESGSHLRVLDDGPGVPAEAREAALKPFVRLETSRTTEGSGLGLSIVAAIAQRSGARVVLGDAGPGLMVDLVFPPAPPPSDQAV